MVYGRHRTARPGTETLHSLPLPFLTQSSTKPQVVASSRRVSAQAHRPRFKPDNQGYSHISVQQRATATAAKSPPETDNKEEDFIRKESVQIEIEEQLLYKDKLTFSPKSPTRPRTFAEATMSRPRGRGGRKDSLKDGDATLSCPMSLESLGPFKYTLKKKKKANKWSPFDLGAADSASEVGSISEVDAASSRAVSPNPQTTLGSASFASAPQKFLSTPSIPALSPPKNKGKGRMIEEETDINDIGETYQTPTQSSFEFTPLAPAALDSSTDTGSFLDSISFNFSPDEVESDRSDTSDTQSTKDRTEAAMASIAEAFGAGKLPKVGEDAFDSVEWDPNLPSASAPDSPEIVPVAPQPVAYTTVGSIVKNAAPSFTAPNRIQREGAGRRPLVPYTQNRPLMPIRRQDSSYFHPRDPPPSLNMQSSMHYTQQLIQCPILFHQSQQPASSHSSPSTVSLRQLSLSEDEQKVLKRVGDPQMVSGNISGSPSTRNPSNKLFTGTTSCDNKLTTETSLPKPFNNQDVGLQALLISDLFGEDGQRRSTNLSGLEKMQTIQRLAKFENPMQELARSRLSALSVTNCLGRTVANPNGLSTALSSPEPTSRKVPPGELDRGYQFPPPGFGSSSTSQTTHLLRSYSDLTFQMPTTRTSGVPQPLTAGPPGQRQSLGVGTTKAITTLNESQKFGGEVTTPSTTYTEYIRHKASQAQLYNPSLNQQNSTNQLLQNLNMVTSQPTAPAQQERNAAFEGEIVGSRLVDSLPVSAISQYYPYGLPSSMDGKYKPLSYEMMVKMGQIPGICGPVTAEEKAAGREEELKEWFYEGQQKSSKTIDDHINDMEERERKRHPSPFGAIGTLEKKTLPVEKKLISPEEMNDMTIAEATAPLLDAAFGTLLGYADQTSESRARLSGWEKSPDWLIDSSGKGNMSFFGEDWGPPPNRVSGTRRYQSTFHNPGTTHWE